MSTFRSLPVSPLGRSLLSLIVAGAAWGTAGAAASLLYLASDLGPLALTFWRCAGGLVLLLGALALRRRRAGTEWAALPVLSQASCFSRTASIPAGQVTIRDAAGL
ncbi:hypothetical protein ACM614_21350, partial [Streptomyces sp. 12297]